MCRYDVDDLDTVWLATMNDERAAMGELPVMAWQMEVVMESLETHCYNNLQTKMKTVEGLGIEYDENVSCDVCKSVCLFGVPFPTRRPAQSTVLITT